MFYKTGVDITNDKQMFEFLKGHFEYPTMNSWNNLCSIANKVKLHSLNLSGNWCVALALLESDDYENINWMIQNWEREHPTYEVYFNGRSNGYLILKDKGYHGHILPDLIVDSENYEDYKKCCRENFGSVKVNRDELVYYTKLVRDFDKLCDELRDYCDKLSNLKYEVVEMEKAVETFNDQYADDLELLGFDPISCDGEGKVDVSEIGTLQSLYEAFLRIADRTNTGYQLIYENNMVTYKER